MSSSAASAPTPSSSNDESTSQQSNEMIVKIQRKLKRIRESVAELRQQEDDILADLEQADAHIKRTQQEEQKRIDEQRQQLKSEQSEWQETAAKIRKVSAAAQRKVTLNIGGQRFEVSIETLTNEQDTFFYVMFSSEQLGFASPVDATTGEVFIDRDATHFRLILNHMRGINILPLVDKLSKEERQLLEVEVDYYQIESLAVLLGMRKVRWNLDETKKHNNLVLIQNDDGSTTVAQKDQSSKNSYDPVLGDTAFSKGIHEWSVRIDSTNYVLIGVCRLYDVQDHIPADSDNSTCNELWGVDCARAKWTQPGKNSPSKVTLSNGQIVHVKLDCNNGKLTIEEEVILVPASEELYPVFVLEKKGKVTLLPRS